MKHLYLSIFPLVMVAGCSETNLDDLDNQELEQIENQVTEDAQSLTEAADEAVKLLEEEIQSELDADGVGAIEENSIANTVEDSEEP